MTPDPFQRSPLGCKLANRHKHSSMFLHRHLYTSKHTIILYFMCLHVRFYQKRTSDSEKQHSGSVWDDFLT